MLADAVDLIVSIFEAIIRFFWSPQNGGAGVGLAIFLIDDIIGGIFGMAEGEQQASAQKQMNERNIELAKENMAWQERMSNSAYQRQVEDLKKANLNPILGYAKGSGGASTPNPPLARVENEYGGSLQKTFSNTKDVMETRKAFEKVDSEVEFNKAATAERAANTLLTLNSAKNAAMQGQVLALNMPKVRSEAQLQKSIAESEKGFQTWDSWMKRVDGFIGSASNAWSAVSNPFKNIRNYLGKKDEYDRVVKERDTYKRQADSYRNSQRKK